MTRPDRETLASLVAEGLTLEEMAKHFGVHSSTVSRWRKAEGLPAWKSRAGKVAGRKSVLTRDQIEVLVQRAERQGWTQAKAAEVAGVSTRTLVNTLRRHDLQWWRTR